MKLFIVEDEEILIKVLREKFEEEKFTVKLAIEGGSAVSLIKNFKPDLILLDIILPKKDGLQILKELKSDPELSSIPVIVLSNLGEDDKIKTALKLGAVDYLVKTQHPINEIVEKVKEYTLASK